MSRQESLARIESEVGVVIRRVKRAIAERAREVHPDLHPITYLTLTYVVERGPVRASELAEQFAVDKGAVSRQVQQLVDLDLLRRTPDPDDGRASLLAATDHGRARVAEVMASRRAVFDRRLGDWSAADLASFADALSRYNTALGGTGQG